MNKRFSQYRSILMVFILTALFATTGCFGDPVKSDLKEYLTYELKAEQENQDFASDFMTNLTSAARDKTEFLKLLNDAKQKINDSSEKQKAYKPKTKEVQDIHEKKVKMLENSSAMITQVTQMVESDNPTEEEINSITQKQQDVIILAKEYRRDLTTLASQKDVEVQLNFR